MAGDYAYSLGVVRPDLLVSTGPFDDAPDAEYQRRVAHDLGYHAALWLDPIFRG